MIEELWSVYSIFELLLRQYERRDTEDGFEERATKKKRKKLKERYRRRGSRNRRIDKSKGQKENKRNERKR